MQFRFPKAVCVACPLRPQCCTGQGGRTISIGRHHDVLQAARVRQQTDAFKTRYRKHRGGIEDNLSALVRGHGMRVARYTGRAKRHLQALFTGVAVNLRRAARWLAGQRPQGKSKARPKALNSAKAPRCALPFSNQGCPSPLPLAHPGQLPLA